MIGFGFVFIFNSIWNVFWFSWLMQGFEALGFVVGEGSWGRRWEWETFDDGSGEVEFVVVLL